MNVLLLPREQFEKLTAGQVVAEIPLRGHGISQGDDIEIRETLDQKKTGRLIRRHVEFTLIGEQYSVGANRCLLVFGS